MPCNVVEADSIEDAKDKVLQAVSQYGKLTEKGFLDFTSDLDLDFTQFDLPDFDMPDFEKPIVSDKIDLGDVEEKLCPNCGCIL